MFRFVAAILAASLLLVGGCLQLPGTQKASAAQLQTHHHCGMVGGGMAGGETMASSGSSLGGGCSS